MHDNMPPLQHGSMTSHPVYNMTHDNTSQWYHILITTCFHYNMSPYNHILMTKWPWYNLHPWHYILMPTWWFYRSDTNMLHCNMSSWHHMLMKTLDTFIWHIQITLELATGQGFSVSWCWVHLPRPPPEPESEAALLPGGAGQVDPARTERNLLLRFAGQETDVLLEPQGCLQLLDTGWQQLKYLTLRPKVLSIFVLIKRL